MKKLIDKIRSLLRLSDRIDYSKCYKSIKWKKVIAITLVFVLVCMIFSRCSIKVSAESPFYIDPISTSVISAASYALMDFWGISFNTSAGTAIGMQTFMDEQVELFAEASGGSVGEVFGTAITKDIAGKLAIGQVTYNKIKDFVQSLIDKFGLSSEEKILTPGQADGQFLPTSYNSGSKCGISIEFYNPVTPTEENPYRSGWNAGRIYNSSGVQITGFRFIGSSDACTGNWGLLFLDNAVWVTLEKVSGKLGTLFYYNSNTVTNLVTLTNRISWGGENYVEPTVLNPNQKWTGYIGGYSDPDTNLEELIGGIFEQAAINDINIEGEVIDDIDPAPTPVPTREPVTDVIDGINEQIGILDNVDTNLDDLIDGIDVITDQIAEQTEVLEGINQGIDDQTGVLSGALDQAAQDVVGTIEDVGEAVIDSVSDLNGTIEEALDIPPASQIGQYKFDLRELFPFCIPWDIQKLLRAFDGNPNAPVAQIRFYFRPINLDYIMNLDFGVWDPVARVLRSAELIAFGLGLCILTSKVIKW